MAERPIPSVKGVIATIAIVACTLAAYWGATDHEFVFYDDNAYVFENPDVIEGVSAEGVKWAFTQIHSANWHPLTWLSHMVDCELYGLDAGKHHRTNVLLHVLNALLLYAVFRSMRCAFKPALGVALLFAVHPLRVESVAWVAERKDILSGFFWMTTLLVYAWYVRRPSVGRYLAVAISFALGLMAKPMLVTLPFVLLLLDVWPLKRFAAYLPPDDGGRLFAQASGRALFLEKIPLVLLAAISAAWTAYAQHVSGVMRTEEVLSLGARIANACTSYASYLWKTVWPTDLSFYYPHPAIFAPERFSIFGVSVIVSALLLAVVTVLVLRVARRMPFLAVGWFWFLGTLVPVIGIVQVGEQAMANRYAYLPLIGIYVALAWGLRALVDRRDAWKLPAVLASIVVVAACVVVTRRETTHWRNSTSLFERAIEVTERNYVAHLNLGFTLSRLGRSEEALAQYRLAEEIRPEHPQVNFNLGVLHKDNGNDEEAIRRFEAALRAQPALGKAHEALGILYARRPDPASALQHFERAAELLPDDARAHSNLALIQQSLGDVDAAAREYREAIRLDPSMTGERMRLAECLQGTGDHAGAVLQYREVLAVSPSMAPAANLLAWILATSHDDSVRDGVEALRIAQSLARIGERPGFLNTLAAALAETGNFDEAVTRQRRAVGLAPAHEKADYRARLELYLSHRPYRW